MTICPYCKEEIKILREKKMGHWGGYYLETTTECGCKNLDKTPVERVYTDCTGSMSYPSKNEAIENHIEWAKEIYENVECRRQKVRHEDQIRSGLDEGHFDSSNYGDRGFGSYGRSFELDATGYALLMDVGDEYCFTLDRDVVEDMMKVMQKFLDMCPEGKE